MPLDIDRILDRRKLTRALTFWRIVAIVALVGAVGLAFGSGGKDMAGQGLSSFAGPYIARIDVTGIIVDDPYRDDRLLDIRDDDHAKALVVRINSPGGTVVGGESLFRFLRLVAEKKPVVAVMGEMAASAGYMTAIAADHIIARAGSITGSIGVIMQTANVTGLLEKIGIQPETIKSAELKATPNPLEPTTEKQRDAARVIIMDMFDMFKDMVAERRGFDAKTINELSDGRIFTGRQAKALGLIDALGGELEAKDWLATNKGVNPELKFQDVDLEAPQTPFRQLFEETIGKTLISERLRLDGLISLWQPNL